MNRRTFLLRIGGTTLAVPAVLVMAACGGGDDDGADSGGQAQFSVSSSGQDHVHQIFIQCSELDAGGNVTYTSTTADAHNHEVILTGDELAMIGAGSTVTKTTTSLHTHTWSIIKPSLAC